MAVGRIDLIKSLETDDGIRNLQQRVAFEVQKIDAENFRDDNLNVIVETWSTISQRLDTNSTYLVMEISADRFQKDIVAQLHDILGQHHLESVDQQLYHDKTIDTWFLVFRLDQHVEAISFESLYFDLPAGVDFHFFRRSPVNHSA